MESLIIFYSFCSMFLMEIRNEIMIVAIILGLLYDADSILM